LSYSPSANAAQVMTDEHGTWQGWTFDPETLRDIARTWHVRWLVARHRHLAAKAITARLVEQQHCGDIRIYRIDKPVASPHETQCRSTERCGTEAVEDLIVATLEIWRRT